MVILREEEMNQTTGELTKGTREYACQTTDDNDNKNHDDDADDDDDDDNAADDDDDDDDDRHNRHDDETTGGRQRICVPDNYQKSVFKLWQNYSLVEQPVDILIKKLTKLSIIDININS